MLTPPQGGKRDRPDRVLVVPLRRTVALAAGLVAVPSAGAHTGAVSDAAWWTQWHLHPVIVPNLILLTALYIMGWRRRHRLQPPPAGVRPWQAWAFAGGMVSLAAALLSPLDVFANELLTVHMIQHTVLMNVAAPLLVLGAPLRVWWWALADERRHHWARWRRTAGRRGWPGYLFWQPLLLWGLFAAMLWTWHLPVLYEAALRYPWIHDVQHLGFFITAALYWRVLFDPLGRRQLGRLRALLYLFTTSLHAALLGVFMALAPRLWYASYAATAPRWGWDPLADQQLAGYVMWMPAGVTYVIVAAGLLAQGLAREPEDLRFSAAAKAAGSGTS